MLFQRILFTESMEPGGSLLCWHGSPSVRSSHLHGYAAPPSLTILHSRSHLWSPPLASARLVTQQPSKPSSRSSPKQKPGPKPKEKRPKLLRTWTEGRRVLSNKTGPKVKDSKGDTERRGQGAGEGSDSIILESFYSDLEDDDDADADEEEEHSNSQGDADVEEQTSSLQNSSSTDLNCQHFGRCSGCVLESALDQPPVFKDAVRFFQCHSIQDLSLTTGSVWEWRCKAKLVVQGTSKNPVIGLYLEGTHNAMDIPNCRAHHPRINAAVELLKAGIRELGVQPYDEDSGSGELRYVQMTITTYNTSVPATERYANGKVQVALVWNARSEQCSSGALLSSLAEFLWQKGGLKSANPIVHSVWANFQTSRTNAIFGGRWRHLLGEQQCWERVGGVDVCLTPASFSQANLQAFEALLRKLQRFVKTGKAVVELYAGSGIIGLSLAATQACRVVRCVEVNKEAGASFELSLSRLPKSNKSKISWHCADVSVSPINWLKGSDIVIVDPPRKGLDVSVIEALRTASFRGQGKSKPPSWEKINKIEKRPWILRAKQAGIQKGSDVIWDDEGTWPESLIYVSCGWEAFKSDCTDLVADGAWHLVAAQAFNFFPGTDSIEVLAVFKRGKKKKVKKKIADGSKGFQKAKMK